MFFKYFFSPKDDILYPPCGMFTRGHLLLFICSIIVIIIFLYICRNLSIIQIRKLTKIFAIIIIVLELIKIVYNLVNGYNNVDSWVPLSYCSLFIYSLIFSGFGNSFLRKIGDAFIVGGGIICGAFFLIMPTTSLTMLPVYHYLCIYSMLFHSLMVSFGILYLKNKIFIPVMDNYKYYVIFSIIFMIPAMIINLIYNSNLMFLSDPYRVPIPLLRTINNNAPVIYTIIIMISYWLTYLGSMGIYYLGKKRNHQ